MKQAWQSVASVAISTMPPSTRSRASDDETVLMTAYSVSFSRRTRDRASPPSVTGETVTRALLSVSDRNREASGPLCPDRPLDRHETCAKSHCTILHNADSVAPGRKGQRSWRGL